MKGFRFVRRIVRAGAVIAAMAAMTVIPTAGRAQDRDLAEATDFRIRVQAALRLGRSGGQEARGDLERGLRDAHPAVRVACAVALSSIGDRSSLPHLEHAYKAESVASARSALKEAQEKLRANVAVARTGRAGVDGAKYVVQLGSMRNNSGVRPNDLDSVMRQAARAKAGAIKGAMIVDGPDAEVVERANERRIPVLLVDANLTRLTQSTGRGGGTVVSARVDLSIRRVPQQTLKGTVSGNASASDDARPSPYALAELQDRAVGAAVESAISSVGSEIAVLAN